MFRVMLWENESGEREWVEVESGEEVWDELEDGDEDGVGSYNRVERLNESGEWERVDWERGRWVVIKS